MDLIILILLIVFIGCSVWSVVVFTVDVFHNSKILSDIEYCGLKRKKVEKNSVKCESELEEEKTNGNSN